MTTPMKSEFLQIMKERGFVQDCTNFAALDEAMNSGYVAGYIGFDATANSLHVGSLLQIMMLRWFQKTGHKPLVLMGGGTTKVGDPSFRASERPLLSDQDIDRNINGIQRVFEKYVSFGDASSDARMLNNSEWLDSLNYLAFLRNIGRHFSVNRMLSFESVKTRLDREQSLSFLEFNYMLLQAYDFLELHQRHDCLVQFGGSDQWGNIVNGIDLTRRVTGNEVFGLTTPLVETADGNKMGKTGNNTVWLNEDMCAPFEFWQYWRNTSDADVGRFLKLFTELPVDECERLGALCGSEVNEAKVILANEVTKLCHGAEAAKSSEETAKVVFSEGGAGRALPRFYLSPREAAEGISLAQLLVRSSLVKSGKEAKRLVAEGGARVDGDVAADAGQMFYSYDLSTDLKLSAGKKRHVLITLGD